MKIRNMIFMLSSSLALILAGCSARDFDPDDPTKSFSLAKEPYDSGNYEIAITKLGEFKSRFPYSKLATEAELLMAHSQFELGQYAECTASYEQFIKLHPNHPNNDLAQYRIGLAFWADAPQEVDREQDLTSRAIDEWERLLKEYPTSKFSSPAKEKILEGKRRIAEAEKFIANFYCKQEIWHACAYRFVTLADTAPGQFKDIIKFALLKAAHAFERMSEIWQEETQSNNLYFRKMNKETLAAQATALKNKAQSF